MRRAASALLLALVATIAGAEMRVEVVLDASQAMWAPLEDFRPAFVGARMALQAWILERAADRDLALGLRRAGGRLPVTDDGSCGDVELLISPGPVNVAGWQDALEGLQPAGNRPLLLALSEAASDLGPDTSPRRVVLLTSGEEGCFGDEQAAIDALSGGVELRIVGVGLPDPVAERLGAVAPTRNARTTVALLAALRWAVEELASAEPPDAPVRVNVAAIGKVTGGSLEDPIGARRRELVLEDGVLGGAAPPGIYTLELTAGDGGQPTRIDGVRIAPGAGVDLSLELPPAPLPDLEVIPARQWAGGPIFVWFGAVGEGLFQVSLAPPDVIGAAWLDTRTAAGPVALLELRAPDEPGLLEVRLDERLGGGLSRAVARTPVEIIPPEAAVSAPEEVKPHDVVVAEWSGPDNPGDHLALVPAVGPQHPPAACWLTAWGSPATLIAPGEEGQWEVRYRSGLSGRTVAGAAVVVTSKIVTLDVPEQVAAGRAFEVAWEGPADAADFLAVAGDEEPSDEYLSLSLASHGSPARFVAPRQPGGYEIRYVDGADGRILRRAALDVVETPVRLNAPRKIRAGSRFEVRWAGPDLPGDFLAVSRPDDPPDRYEDWAYTSQGSPTSLAAPFEAGSYELRYVSAGGREVLATIQIEVEEP